jgi:hypothetical protein
MQNEDNDSDSSALHFTNANLTDQLRHLIPQIHLTLTSVLQAVSLAFLLTSFHLHRSQALNNSWWGCWRCISISPRSSLSW